jgi:ribosomal protein S18 acetylase RimI-like enzyme
MTFFDKKFINNQIECTVRVLTEADLEGLLTIKDLPEVHTQRFKLQDENKACYLGAIVGGNVVGFVLVSFTKEDIQVCTDGKQCADMIDLLVSEHFRGLGIGTSLIKSAENVCKVKGIPFLGLDVNPKDNPRAMGLYESLDYKVVGELHLDGVYDTVDEDGNTAKYEDWCVDMIKDLSFYE